MEANLESLFYQPMKISDILSSNNYVVVFDTNVLLDAYRWRSNTLDEIENVLKDLNENGKLKFSLHVLKEFVKNRNNQINQIITQINGQKRSFDNTSNIKQLHKIAPIIATSDVFESAEKLRKDIIEKQKEFIEKLKEIESKIRELFYKDEFFDLIANLSQKNYIQDYSQEYMSELKAKFQERAKDSIPPGYKDFNKGSNASGDYIIWEDLMTLNTNVIFVTNDTKEDWVIKDVSNNIVVPHESLYREFHSKTGCHFGIMNTAEFIVLYNPQIESEIKSDLIKKQEFNKSYGFNNMDLPLGSNTKESILEKSKNDFQLKDLLIYNLIKNIGPEKIINMSFSELQSYIEIELLFNEKMYIHYLNPLNTAIVYGDDGKTPNYNFVEEVAESAEIMLFSKK